MNDREREEFDHLEEHIGFLAEDALAMSGQRDEIFTGLFSRAVDEAYPHGSRFRKEAISFAEKHGYIDLNLAKDCLGATKDEILNIFKQLSNGYSGLRIIEAEIIGAGQRFRWQGSGKLGVVIGEIGIRDATSAEYGELEESIELGQVQISSRPLYFSGRSLLADVVVLHRATGFPMNENSQAAIQQRERFARIDAHRIKMR